MKKQNKKRKGGGESVMKKEKSYKDTLQFLTSVKNDLTNTKNSVTKHLTNIKNELDFINSLIEENK